MELPPPINFSWSSVDELSRKVAQAVGAAEYSVDVVLGIARGGLTPAVHISHLLQVRSFRTAIVESTTTDSAYAPRLEAPRIASEVTEDVLRDRNVLVVDDAVSTGATVQAVLDYIVAFRPAQVRVAVLAQDTAVSDKDLARANDIIDFVGTRVYGWAIFPWTS
jgi:hypoxanthine phosphoribosyltransferase